MPLSINRKPNRHTNTFLSTTTKIHNLIILPLIENVILTEQTFVCLIQQYIENVLKLIKASSRDFIFMFRYYLPLK